MCTTDKIMYSLNISVVGDQVYIPPPVFINKKPKYPSAYRPYNTLTIQPPNNTNKIPPYSYEQFLQKKIKRKYIRSEAERACAKEAAASRQALEALQKELVVQPQVNSFLVEDSCTETTVENFIPHTEEQQYVENVNEFQDVQVINYYRVNDETTADEYANNTRDGQQIANNERSANHLLQFNAQTEVTSSTDDKSVESAGEVTHNVEIMFKTSEGNFVSVTDELLQNISKSALHYQLVDENGYAGEMQELRVLNKTVLDGNDVSHKFIYQQGPSTILNEDLDQNTTVIGEDESMNELVEPIKIKSEETDDDGMIKHEENADYESCLDFLMPDEHTDSVETAENYIPNFSLTPFEDQYEQNNLLDSHHENILENVDQHQHILQNVEGGDGQYQADFEMCVTPKKPKLMKEKHKSHRRQEAKRKFSPRRTRSTVKYHNMPSLSDFENYGEDVRYKTRNRK